MGPVDPLDLKDCRLSNKLDHLVNPGLGSRGRAPGRCEWEGCRGGREPKPSPHDPGDRGRVGPDWGLGPSPNSGGPGGKAPRKTKNPAVGIDKKGQKKGLTLSGRFRITAFT
jgi:hypothetical protein